MITTQLNRLERQGIDLRYRSWTIRLRHLPAGQPVRVVGFLFAESFEMPPPIVVVGTGSIFSGSLQILRSAPCLDPRIHPTYALDSCWEGETPVYDILPVLLAQEQEAVLILGDGVWLFEHRIKQQLISLDTLCDSSPAFLLCPKRFVLTTTGALIVRAESIEPGPTVADVRPSFDLTPILNEIGVDVGTTIARLERYWHYV